MFITPNHIYLRRRSQLKKESKKKSGGKKDNADQSDAPAVSKPATIKEKTPEERKAAHVQGIIKTAVAAFLGMIAGFGAFYRFSDGTGTPWYAAIVIIAVLAYYAQRVIFPAIKIDTKEFGPKDWFYVEFIVIDFCLVTWTLLLN